MRRSRSLAAALGAVLLAAAAQAPCQPAAPRARTPIPFKQDEESSASLAGRSIAVLALAGLAAYGGALALKRFGIGRIAVPGKTRRVRLAESIRLSRRSVLHVVHYRGEELLLAESEHGLQLVASRAGEPGDA